MYARFGLNCSLAVTTAAVIAAGALSAQEARPGSGLGAQIIVRALANGAPVTDLKAEDLAVRINGKALDVSALQLVSAADAATGAPAPAAAAPKPSSLPPPF